MDAIIPSLQDTIISKRRCTFSQKQDHELPKKRFRLYDTHFPQLHKNSTKQSRRTPLPTITFRHESHSIPRQFQRRLAFNSRRRAPRPISRLHSQEQTQQSASYQRKCEHVATLRRDGECAVPNPWLSETHSLPSRGHQTSLVPTRVYDFNSRHPRAISTPRKRRRPTQTHTGYSPARRHPTPRRGPIHPASLVPHRYTSTCGT